MPDYYSLLVFNPAAYASAGAVLSAAAREVGTARDTFRTTTAGMPTWWGRAREGHDRRAERVRSDAGLAVDALEQAGRAMTDGASRLAAVVTELRGTTDQVLAQGFVVLPAGVVLPGPEHMANPEALPAFEAEAEAYTLRLESIVARGTAEDEATAGQIRAAGAPLDYGFGDAGTASGLTPVTITVALQEGMSKAEARSKAAQLKLLSDMGALRKTASGEKWRDRTVTDSYRAYVLGQIQRRYAHNPDLQAALMDRVRRTMSPDHRQELQLGSPDTWSALRFLDRETNERFGFRVIRPQIASLPNGTPIRVQVTNFD